ncbi:MAG: hypothetical protein ACRDSF_07845 [Pseudonocardiaceae bacterium]
MISHESAPELHAPSDVIPMAVRLSLPRVKRGQRPRPGVRVSASLAGREFETFLLDIGFRVISTEGIEALTTRTCSCLRGLPPVTVPALPLETQVAEKLHRDVVSEVD